MVESQVGVGSPFSVVLPRRYQQGLEEPHATVPEGRQLQSSQPVILVIEDEEATCFLYERYLHGCGFRLLIARTVWQARSILRQVQPCLIFLDIVLPGEDAWILLADLKSHTETQHIPVVVVTTQAEQRKALALRADAYCLKPIDRHWLLKTVQQFTRQEPTETILIIDDDAGARYVLSHALTSTPYGIREAASGLEGLFKMRQERPRAVFLDLHLPDMSGFEVLDRLQADPQTHDIPVIVYTAQVLDPEACHQLTARGVTLLQKDACTGAAVLACLASVQHG